MEKDKNQELAFENQLWEADSNIEETTGIAQALYDQINDVVAPIIRVDNYAAMSDEQMSMVAQTVISRKKALLALSNILLDKLDQIHDQLQ
ncbi:hypothetical protein PSQ53_09260 [Limosilactobacillus reuteri]|uniref:Uncharacterized protein n=1 Tax=Limosilactobacillus reuteri TaxID=1598 RepID=A0AAW6JDZ4_LIMRT|nr:MULTISPECIES: hypothetical protein [Limosilactobacillus]MDD1383090.1 hypothetical protein [Limosilactobacillus reuteri]MDD1399314.1 hypothetical protein [Limosilactobacillus reuteri]MDD1404528.1 hypothetical protein [Limosilactobacillus reuteri]QIZ04099.1 hypothetical protein GXL24_03600 [Limosilactobacillus reuteri]